MRTFDTLEIGLHEVKDILIERFLFQLTNPKDKLRPIYLEGHAGIGKTQVIHQVTAQLSRQLRKPVHCQTLNLQFCERPDFMGLPRIDADGDTVFARPKILPKEGLGILFLDEANRVDSDIQSGMLTLLEDRNINGHQIGSDWMIVLAGNPGAAAGGSQYKVGDFDFALQDRIATVRVTGNIEDLTQYLRTKYPGHPLLHILEYSPDFISFDGQGCSPRSFEYALRATLGLSDLKDKSILRQLALELGPAAASHILRLLGTGYVPTIKGVLKRDPKVYQFLDSNPDRQDVLHTLIDQIYGYIVANANKNEPIQVDDVSAIVEFLMLVQNEHRLALFEKIRGSKYSVYFGQHFLKNTRLAEVLYAKRAIAA